MNKIITNIKNTNNKFARTRTNSIFSPSSADKLATPLALSEFSFGRSMIEMLGVLAIIAVLSVGGIAGYSKAMEKFKHDKWLHQIETLIFNIKDTYKNQKQYGQIGDNLLPTLKNLGLVNDMIDENNLDIFGNQVHVDMRTRGTFTRLNLQFDMLPSSDSVQNCHDLLQLIKWHNNDIWAIALCPDKNCDGSWFYQICGKAAPQDFINRVTCMDYDLAQIMKKCQYCHTNSCYAIILFDNNV